jgi:hypothetical protein
MTAGTKYNTSQLVYACSETTYCCSSYQGKDVPVLAYDTKGNYSCCDDPSQVFDAGPANFLSGEKDFTTSMFPATATAAGSGKSLTVFRTVGSGTTSVAAATTVLVTDYTATAVQSTDPTESSNSKQDSSSSTASASSSSDLSTAAKAGIAIGAVAVAVLAIVSAAWLMLRSRQQRTQENMPPTGFNATIDSASQGGAWQEQKSGAMVGYAYEIGNGMPGLRELDARRLNELDARRFSGRRELP